MTSPVRFRVNGRAVAVDGPPGRTLLWALRGDLALTGAKYGCGAGVCGACTVVVDGQAVRSCQVPLGFVQGKDVLTIEGLARDGVLHPLQQAFIEQGALQCGYCTPGMLMTAHALLARSPRPSADAIAKGMEDNLCRCGAYKRILAAVAGVAAAGGRP